LGIKPRYDGLEIDPSIPKGWGGFKLTRVFRGTTYNITVKNPDNVCKGVVKMLVDGEEKPGNTVPAFAGGIHEIEITLG
jgi:cellobiose phosphorylase